MTKGFAQRWTRAFRVAVATGCLASAGVWAQADKKTATDKLQVYMIDVEGGQSTLFVTPTGQSLLIDTGWPGHEYRDADRIVAAADLWRPLPPMLPAALEGEACELEGYAIGYCCLAPVPRPARTGAARHRRRRPLAPGAG